jgi:pSer/pThr/pTyr-binding forkhead associated (FHA) protein
MSKNGTWVNNVRLAAGSTKELADGDVVKLGETLLHLRCPDPPPFNKNDKLESMQTLVTPREMIVTNVVADVRGFCSMSQTGRRRNLTKSMK